MNLVLIGLRGSGKSTVAKLLAEKLSWSWIDADEMIETLAGRSIAEIFAAGGEEKFRDLEGQVIEQLAGHSNCVMALGGGAILRPQNREIIARLGRVVWLQASPQAMWTRIQADPATAARRPPLSAAGGINEIIATLGAREEIYRQSSDLAVDTDNTAPELVADTILAKLELS